MRVCFGGQVNAAPSSGNFGVDPEVGTATVDSFALIMTDWVDDAEDLPFTYEFRYALPSGDNPTEEVPLGAVDINWIQAHLPPPPDPAAPNHNVTLVGYVIDLRAGRTRSELSVRVLRPPAVNATGSQGAARRVGGAPVSASLAQLDAFVATGNAEGIVQLVTALAQDDSLGCADREAMVATLSDAAAKMVMSAAQVAGFAASVRAVTLKPCAGGRRLMSDDATSRTLRLTSSLVSSSQAAGLDPTAESGLGNTLSNALGSIATKNAARRRLRALLGAGASPAVAGFARGRRAGTQNQQVRGHSFTHTCGSSLSLSLSLS